MQLTHACREKPDDCIFQRVVKKDDEPWKVVEMGYMGFFVVDRLIRELPDGICPWCTANLNEAQKP